MITNSAIERSVILTQAQAYFEKAIYESQNRRFDIASEAWTRASTLIELVEVDDCGQIGGFDEGRGQIPPMTLEQRLKWLRALPIDESFKKKYEMLVAKLQAMK